MIANFLSNHVLIPTMFMSYRSAILLPLLLILYFAEICSESIENPRNAEVTVGILLKRAFKEVTFTIEGKEFILQKDFQNLHPISQINCSESFLFHQDFADYSTITYCEVDFKSLCYVYEKQCQYPWR